MKKWRCTVCGYIHEGDHPPDNCPICGAPAEKFELINGAENQEAKKGMVPEITEADIVVVGTGAAAFSAAITAKQNGAEVIMVEKAHEIGGTTYRSGGALWIPDNRYQKEMDLPESKEDAIRYMVRYSYPHLYNPNHKTLGLPQNNYDLIETFCNEAGNMHDFMDSIGALKTIIDINWTGQPQPDYLDSLPENKGIRGRSIFPMGPDGKHSYGFELIRQLHEWSKANGIHIYTGHEASAILRDETGAVIGVNTRMDGGDHKFIAKKGVIFGSGGYSHNPDMMLSFQRGPHFGGCSVPTNTGDFIRLGGKIGAKIGNTAGAFRAQSLFEASIANPDGSNNAFYIGGDSVFEVNRYGKRVMDEKRDYTDRAMMHFVWDPVRAEWTNMLLFVICDERVAKGWAGMAPYPPTLDTAYLIKGETLAELGENINLRLKDYGKHTGGFSLDDTFVENLVKTKETFNQYAINGKDDDFRRGEFNYDREFTSLPPMVTNPEEPWPPKDSKNYTMYPLSDKGPYYGIIMAAGTLDTCGGPVINKKGQVLDVDSQVIPGLYGAGNCIASPVANAYWGAGATIGLGMTYGYLAALDALSR